MTERAPRRTEITLSGDDAIIVTASFELPADAVFRAFTDPELVTQWWGRPGGELTTCEIDLRAGGNWRYVYQPGDGEPVRFHGTYSKVIPGDLLEYTDVLENLGGIEVSNTVTFSEGDGRTTLTILAKHKNTANRDRQAATISLGPDGPEPFDVLEQVMLARG